MKRVAVVGLGYVGLPLAIAIDSVGFETIGFDINEKLVENLKSGKSHIEDVDSNLLSHAQNKGNLLVTSDIKSIEDVDVYVITVPTPLTEDRKPDTSYVEKAAEIIGKSITKQCIVINESTSYPGTLKEIVIKKVNEYKRIPAEIYFAAAPERIDPGNKDWKISNTPRLIAGIDKKSSEVALDFYSTFCNEVHIAESPELVEIAKLFENTFRQVNIALVNEFSLICLNLGVDVLKALDAANTKPMGFMKFTPGIGVGGHCIPVDPTFLAYAAEKTGHQSEFIKLSNQVNQDMPRLVYEALNKYRNINGKRILVVGIAYKENISDVRESPGVKFLEILREHGISADWYDPVVKHWNSEKSADLALQNYDYGVYIKHHDLNLMDAIIDSCAEIVDLTGKIQSKNVVEFTGLGRKN